MQSDDFPSIDIDHGGTGIPAQRRTVVRGNILLDATTLIDRPPRHSSWLHAFDFVNATKNLILQFNVAAMIFCRVSDHNDSLILQFFRSCRGKVENRMLVAQSFDFQQRHVPVRVNHFDRRDFPEIRIKHTSLRLFTSKVDRGRLTRIESKVSGSPTLCKNSSDVTIGHQEIFANNKPRTCIRSTSKIVRNLHSSNRRNAVRNSLFRCLSPQYLPLTDTRSAERIVDDIDRWPSRSVDDCFKTEQFVLRNIRFLTIPHQSIQRLNGFFISSGHGLENSIATCFRRLLKMVTNRF